MSFLGDGETLDRFLSKGRVLCLAAVPVCWVLCVFFIAEEGWRFGFLIGFLLPPVAAYLGFAGHREVRPGMTALAGALALATVPLALGLAWLEGR